MNPTSRFCAIALAALFALPSLAGPKALPTEGEPGARTVYLPRAIAWDIRFEHRTASLRISGPGEYLHEREFGSLKPVFDLAKLPALADGRYKFELVLGRQPDQDLLKLVESTPLGEDGAIAKREVRARLGLLREAVTGAFRVEAGTILSPDRVEAKAAPKGLLTGSDGTIRNSLCVGFDCLDIENFGATTVKLKENNTRILFDDTSTLAGFPFHDWQLTANESASGGLDKFSIEDVTAGSVPFTVEGGSPSNSLYVDSTGRIGLRTTVPARDLHARTGNTPAIRLEQDGSSGFTPQTWDVAGNEANFFVMDVTGGSALPFRIKPGSPSNSLMIGGSSGSVGIGIESPDANSRLHVANGVLNLDDDRAVAWGGGSFRPAILGNKPGQFFAMYTAGVERLRVDTSVISFLDATPLAWGTGSARPAIVGNKASNLLTMHIAGAERLRADTAGIKITGTLHLNGNPLPDYVFAPGFKLATIEENAAYMWKNRHLPAVGAARTTADGQGVMDVYSQSRGMLEELEKAHIYIEQLHREIKAMKADIAELRKRVEK